MKILLVGEYSRLHNSLKEGLQELGHEALLVGTGDYFKRYPVDINIDASWITRHKFLNFLRKAVHKVTAIDLAATETGIRYALKMHLFKGFDVVQFINSDAIRTHLVLQKYFISKLKKFNQHLYLLVCGDDHPVISYLINKSENPFKYHILTPYLENQDLKRHFAPSLRYLKPRFTELYRYVFNNVDGIICSDIDYMIPMMTSDKYLGLIPNPINIDKLPFQKISITDKIVIFLGINTHSRLKKGTKYFLEALEPIKKKYAKHIQVVMVENIAYEDYIMAYDNCHILLDQVYSYDQGYNALEAMAKGKVVFTGAEREWLNHYNINENSVAINAEPDSKKIADKLEWLIKNPNKINEISENARTFIEKEHHYIQSAKKYLKTWKHIAL